MGTIGSGPATSVRVLLTKIQFIKHERIIRTRHEFARPELYGAQPKSIRRGKAAGPRKRHEFEHDTHHRLEEWA